MSGYDGDFYEDYKRYLCESGVRQAHWFPLSIAKQESAFRNVVDLGCGLREFQSYAEPLQYIGIDNAIIPADGRPNYIAADYRHDATIEEIKDYCAKDEGRLTPSAFVSLFSSEITACAEVNYALYRRLFDRVSSIRRALVSGFYYDYRVGETIVEEVPGFFSYQTIEPLEASLERAHGRFTEKRVVIPCPSKMFGEGVIEVWKFFEKTYR